MRANALPIGDNPVFMIGADRCAEGQFGDWSLCQRIGRLVMDWRIGDGLANWCGLADWYEIGVGERLVMNWQICHGLALYWSRIIRLALIGRLAAD